MFLRPLLIGLALLVAAAPSYAHHGSDHDGASEQAAVGPVIGAPAPELGPAIHTDGTLASLDSLKGEKGTIVAFVRSADWCPFCKRQLIELSKAEAQIAESGWQLVGLSYDSPDKLTAFAGASSIAFPLLSDEESETIRAYGLLNEEYPVDSGAYGVPHPALVFINPDGEVTAVLREEGYRDRPSVDVINETIAELDASVAQ